MHISWARLASFCHLGFISDPLIVSKFHNETHDPKGQENKIYTIVKGRETFYRRHTILFWFIENSDEILDKLKARDFNASSLSTYDFSTLYTTLPHNLIKDKLIDPIERTFQREDSPHLPCYDRNAFFTSKNLKNIMHGHVKMYVMRWPFCWTTFLCDLATSCIDK